MRERRAGRQPSAACGGSGLSGVPFARLPVLKKRPSPADAPRLVGSARPAHVHAPGPHRQAVSNYITFGRFWRHLSLLGRIGHKSELCPILMHH